MGYLAFVSSRRSDFLETDNPLCPFTSKERQILMFQMVRLPWRLRKTLFGFAFRSLSPCLLFVSLN